MTRKRVMDKARGMDSWGVARFTLMVNPFRPFWVGLLVVPFRLLWFTLGTLRKGIPQSFVGYLTKM